MPSICRQPIFGALRDQASDVILTGIPEQRSTKTRNRRTSDQSESGKHDEVLQMFSLNVNLLTNLPMGLAEFERSLILSRTQEGREVAMARGVAFGRPSKQREDQKDAVRDLVKNGRSISVVARTFNVHPATIYRCLAEK